MKEIIFDGRSISIAEARAIIDDLSLSLSKVANDIPVNPIPGAPMRAIVDPRWYCEVSQPSKVNIPGIGHQIDGVMLCIVDPGVGWRANILPWGSAATLLSTLAQQLAGRAASR